MIPPRRGPSIILQTEILNYVHPIFDAGELCGKAVGRKIPWWKSNDRELLEIELAWKAYDAGFDRLFDRIERLVQEAYANGVEHGRETVKP